MVRVAVGRETYGQPHHQSRICQTKKNHYNADDLYSSVSYRKQSRERGQKKDAYKNHPACA